MSDALEITINCPLCSGAILYPPDREGEEVPCPHCDEQIYLLSDMPPDPPAVNPTPDPDPVDSDPTPATETDGVVLHASTQQKIHSNTKRKAVIKQGARNPGATPPNRKKISPPESDVLKIPHVFPAVELEREGTSLSPELFFRHPSDFVLDRSGGGLRKKGEVWQCRWMAVYVQTDRKAKPWVTLNLTATLARPGHCNSLTLTAGAKRFDLATDAAGDRAREESERGSKKVAGEGLTSLKERFSFEHDDFRYLCGELALNEAMSLKIDGIGEPIDEDTCAEFREYTLEFFEALRRLYPIFFR